MSHDQIKCTGKLNQWHEFSRKINVNNRYIILENMIEILVKEKRFDSIIFRELVINLQKQRVNKGQYQIHETHSQTSAQIYTIVYPNYGC